MNIPLLFGAILGLLSVIVAAYLDHTLAIYLTSKSLNSMLTAIKYHQLYALLVSVIGLSLFLQANSRLKLWLTITAYLFSSGIILFSFSIYASIIFNIRGIIYLTPVGGMILMLGWISLIRIALLKMK